MTQSCYVGIENEFTLYQHHNRRYTPIDFPSVFGELLEKYNENCFRKTTTCIRTVHGGCIYADGDEAEICTPPVRVTPGFATSLADALHNARYDLIKMIEGGDHLALVGYSMHHNVSARPGTSDETFMRRYALPLSMFALTPRSVGINMRDPTGRRELLGDYIENREQVIALTLLYTAAQLHPLISPPRILEDGPWSFDTGYKNLVREGRASKAMVKRKELIAEATAQEILEETWTALRPGIEEISTMDERELLKSFITGKRTLEIDKTDIYARHVKRGMDGTTIPNRTTMVRPKDYDEDYWFEGAARALAILGSSDAPRSEELPAFRTLELEWDSATFAIDRSLYAFKNIDELEVAGRTVYNSGPDDIWLLGDVARVLRCASIKQIRTQLKGAHPENKKLQDTLNRYAFIDGRRRTSKGERLLDACEQVLSSIAQQPKTTRNG